MTQTATLAGGCFWCTEAIFKRLKGVLQVTPGYSGGKTKNPTYEEVSRGDTGHAESIQVTFDPDEISYEEILEVFFATHNPTTFNRQGADTGSQYRSAIFFHSPKQKATAKSVISKIQSSYSDTIVTEVTKFSGFTAAEDYHKNYYDSNKNNAYCKFVIDPKVKKFLKDFGEKLKA